MPVKWRNTALMTQRWRLLRGEELFDMAQDPGQQHDVAAAHPDVVRKLNADHDAWWSSVSERFDVPARVVIGAKQANPTDINCHDLRIDGSGRFPWKQHLMRKGVAATGYWSIDVARPGTYRFTLRRWPKHLRTPISGAIQDGRALNITQARIRVGEEDQSIPVTPEMVGAAFQLELDAGPTQMQTWFDQENGETGNAYFVEVERVTQHAS